MIIVLGVAFCVAMGAMFFFLRMYWRLRRAVKWKSSDEELNAVQYNAATEETHILHGGVGDGDRETLMNRRVLCERLRDGVEREVENVGAINFETNDVDTMFQFK